MAYPQKSFTVWFTGLPCSGKTTLSNAVEIELRSQDLGVILLDGDRLRKKLSRNLGFSKKDRFTHVQRVTDLAASLNEDGDIALVSLISPYRAMRENARKQIETFVEVFVQCPLAICEKRDVKGMYKLARRGGIKHFTGVSDVYEKPLNPEIVVDTDIRRISTCTKQILHYLEFNELIPQKRQRSQKEHS